MSSEWNIVVGRSMDVESRRDASPASRRKLRRMKLIPRENDAMLDGGDVVVAALSPLETTMIGKAITDGLSEEQLNLGADDRKRMKEHS